jgi:O-antigen ligase
MEAIKYAILVGAVLACMFSKRWGLAVFAFFVPLVQWLPDTMIPGINALNLMLVPLVIRAMTAGPVPAGTAGGEPLLFPSIVIVVMTTLAWARVAFTTMLPPGFVESGGLYDNFVTYKEIIVAFVMYYCSRRLTRDPQAVRRVVGGVIAGLMFEGGTAAREFLFGHASRATAHLGQPNKLGDFLSGYLMLSLAFVLDRIRGWYFVSLVGLGLAALGLMGAVSRGAILAAGASVFLCALLRRSAWIVVIAAVLVTSPVWLPEKVMKRFESTVTSGDSGEVELDTEHEGRFDLWASGLRMIAHQPAFGVGLGMFPYHLRENGYAGRKLKTSHNILVQFSAEQGVPCALAHLLIMLTIGTIGWKTAQRDRGTFEGAFGLGMFGATIAFMVGTMFGDGFYENNLSGGYWIAAGALISLWKSESPAEPIDSNETVSA